MPNVFISYARADAHFAQQLSDALRAEGQTVFFDFAIVAGEDFSKKIEKALSDADAVVVLLSQNSNRSSWVEAELRNALQSDPIVIPVLLDDEATNNWVWPLVSDRKAIKLGEKEDIVEIAKEITQALNYKERSSLSPILPPRFDVNALLPMKRSSAWLTLLIAVLSALAGAIAVWLTK